MSAHNGFMGKKGRPAFLKVSEKSRSNGNRLGASSLTLSLLAVTFSSADNLCKQFGSISGLTE